MKNLKIFLIFTLIIVLFGCGNKEGDKEKISTPVFRPGSSSFTEPISVVIECDFENVRIYFTTDDTDPTEHSRLFTEPIHVATTTIIRARAYRSGYTASDVVRATYTLNKVQPPIFSLAEGIYYEPQELSLRGVAQQDSVFFTTNGQEPIAHPYFRYEEPIILPFNEFNHIVIKAKAFRQNWLPSDTITREYEFRMSRMIAVQGGTFHPSATYTVSLSDFFINNYLVSQAEWAEIMEGNNNNISPFPSISSQDENSPVDMISWYEAIVYCNRRSIHEGLEPVYARNSNTNPNTWGFVPENYEETWDRITKDMSRNGYRLPTEMEWHFAARGGNFSGNFRYAGSNNVDEVAWYIENSEGTTHPVGSKKANELQLYDMSGNVWEWLWDWYAIELPSGSAVNPTGPTSGEFRSLRGGSYLHDATRSEVGFRDGIGNPWYRDRDRGFRVVRN